MLWQRTSTGVPPWLMAIIAMLSVQIANAFSIGVIAEVGAPATAWLRMCFGGLLLLLIVRPSFRSVRARDLPALLGLGAASGGMTVAFLSAIERISLGTAVAIEFLGPLTVAAVMSKNRKMLIWPALAFVGVVMLTEPWEGQVDLIGIGWALLSALCWGLYNIFTQSVGDRFSGITGLSFAIPVAAVLTTPVGLPELIGTSFPWWVFPAMAGIAILTPVIAFALEMLALRRMTQTAFGTFVAIEPAFGMLVGAVMLSQLPSWLQLVGLALVVLAGTSAQRGGRRAVPPG